MAKQLSADVRVVATILVFMLAGCAASTRTLGTTTTTSSSTTSSSTTPPTPDQATAEQMTLTAADLGTGWTSSPADAQTKQFISDQMSCYGLPPAAQEFPTQEYGDTFTQGTQAIGSMALVTSTAQERQRINDAMTDYNNQSCVAHVGTQAIKDYINMPDAAVTVIITPLTTLKFNSNETGYRTTMSVAGTDGKIEIVVDDALAVTDGKFYAQVAIESRDTAPSEDLDQQMLDLLQNHVTAANAH